MKTKWVLAVIFIAAGIAFWLQLQTQRNLHAQMNSLQQQIAQLQSDNESLSNRLAAANSNLLSDAQKNELLKLRGEVSRLRQQANELNKLGAENQQLKSQNLYAQDRLAQIDAEAQFKQHRIDLVNALKQLCLAMRIYAGDHNEQYATRFDQLINGGEITTTNFSGGISTADFDFMNIGLVNDTMPDKIIFREKTPRPIANGNWERIYGLADGSVQTVTSDDPAFTVWEQQHSPQPNQ